MDSDNRPVCNIPTDGTCVSIKELLQSRDCKIPAGSCFDVQQKIVDKHNHEVDGDWQKDSHGEWVARTECDHKDSPEYKAEHKKVEKIVKAESSQTDTDISTATQTVAIVEVPTQEVKPPEKPPSFETALPVVMGVVGGIAGPMLTNFIKNFLKNKFKKTEQKEEEPEEPTDCKTHQIKSNAKLISIVKRIGLLEKQVAQKPQKCNDLEVDVDQIEDLTKRIEKLEKTYLNKK